MEQDEQNLSDEEKNKLVEDLFKDVQKKYYFLNLTLEQVEAAFRAAHSHYEGVIERGDEKGNRSEVLYRDWIRLSIRNEIFTQGLINLRFQNFKEEGKEAVKEADKMLRDVFGLPTNGDAFDLPDDPNSLFWSDDIDLFMN